MKPLLLKIYLTRDGERYCFAHDPDRVPWSFVCKELARLQAEGWMIESGETEDGEW